MKLHEQPSGLLQRITAHGNGTIVISGTAVRFPCLVNATQRIAPWIAGIDALDGSALEALWPMQPQIVLLGHTPADPARWRDIRRLCSARSIALEVMDLGAACRTFNVLATEDRAVAAMLFP
jgi:uncharacterized protein